MVTYLKRDQSKINKNNIIIDNHCTKWSYEDEQQWKVLLLLLLDDKKQSCGSNNYKIHFTTISKDFIRFYLQQQRTSSS